MPLKMIQLQPFKNLYKLQILFQIQNRLANTFSIRDDLLKDLASDVSGDSTTNAWQMSKNT